MVQRGAALWTLNSVLECFLSGGLLKLRFLTQSGGEERVKQQGKARNNT